MDRTPSQRSNSDLRHTQGGLQQNSNLAEPRPRTLAPASSLVWAGWWTGPLVSNAFTRGHSACPRRRASATHAPGPGGPEARTKRIRWPECLLSSPDTKGWMGAVPGSGGRVTPGSPPIHSHSAGCCSGTHTSVGFAIRIQLQTANRPVFADTHRSLGHNNITMLSLAGEVHHCSRQPNQTQRLCVSSLAPLPQFWGLHRRLGTNRRTGGAPSTRCGGRTLPRPTGGTATGLSTEVSGDSAAVLAPRGVPGRLVTDSGLDAFSQYPSHGSLAAPATRLTAETRGAA